MNTIAEGDAQLAFLQALAGVAARLREAGSLAEAMADPDGVAAALFACDRFTLYAVDAEGDYLVSKAKGADGAVRDVKVAIAPHAIAGHVALSRRAVNVADAYDDVELARIAPGLRFPRGVDQRTGYRTRQVLAVPVAAPGTQAPLGVIQLVNTHDGKPFSPHALAGAAQLGEALAPLFPARPGRAQAAAPSASAPPAPPAMAVPPAVEMAPATRAVVPAPAADESARVLARIVTDAIRLGASAIHVEAAADGGGTIRLRRDGTLAPYASLAQARAAALVRHVEAACGLDRATRHGTLQGRAHGLPDVALHAAMIPSTAGRDLVLRIGAAGAAVPLAHLGMAPGDLARLRAVLDGARGLLLVAGPRDAGRSTTLHALLASLNGPERKLCTAEDPVTLAQPGLRQVRVGRAAGIDAAEALEAFRHADADVVMVDAPFGREAAGLAVEAALAGRLVLAALPARNAPEAALRLLGLAADPFGAADALAGVLAQRLAKRLCTACRQPYHPGAAELDLLLAEYCAEMAPGGDTGAAVTDAARLRVLAGWRERHAGADGRFTLYRAAGCAACHGGYRGRAGLFELMTAGERTARLLAQRPGAARLAEAALEDGLRTLKMDGIDKVLAGITDIGMVRAACAR